MTYKLYTDGGARGNPGPAGIGAVLYDTSGNVIFEKKDYLGVSTNNEAEYKGLIFGLESALAREVKDIVCHLDSELVVKQLNGEYRVKSPHLRELYNRVKELEGTYNSISYLHVPRAKNKVADSLVNRVLDEKESSKNG